MQRIKSAPYFGTLSSFGIKEHNDRSIDDIPDFGTLSSFGINVEKHSIPIKKRRKKAT